MAGTKIPLMPRDAKPSVVEKSAANLGFEAKHWLTADKRSSSCPNCALSLKNILFQAA